MEPPPPRNEEQVEEHHQEPLIGTVVFTGHQPTEHSDFVCTWQHCEFIAKYEKQADQYPQHMF